MIDLTLIDQYLKLFLGLGGAVGLVYGFGSWVFTNLGRLVKKVTEPLQAATKAVNTLSAKLAETSAGLATLEKEVHAIKGDLEGVKLEMARIGGRQEVIREDLN